MESFSKNIIIIGSSAGGPRTLCDIFKDLPLIKATIIIVQHMPLFLNESIKEELNNLTNMSVKIASKGEVLSDGIVYIAPSKLHLSLSNNEIVKLQSGALVNFVKPAIDVIMKSLKLTPDYKFTGIILTGMGKDGTEGICHIKKLGGITIAQEQSSCMQPFMPIAAISTGNIDQILPPDMIRTRIIEIAEPNKSNKTTTKNPS